MKWILLILTLMMSVSTYANTLKNWDTDYCTFFPEGTRRNPDLWKHCCLEHDLRYWIGGSKQDQYISDLKLKSCVRKLGLRTLSRLMYWAIRIGHYSPKKSRWAWSWGWNTKRGFKQLTEDEKHYVRLEIEHLELPQDLKERFIRENL
jgi:hypothetical protein